MNHDQTKAIELISMELFLSFCLEISQQNGQAKRKHRQILNSVHAMLIRTALPEQLCAETAIIVVYTINNTHLSVLKDHSPYEHLNGFASDYSHLHVFGSTCFVLL